MENFDRNHFLKLVSQGVPIRLAALFAGNTLEYIYKMFSEEKNFTKDIILARSIFLSGYIKSLWYISEIQD